MYVYFRAFKFPTNKKKKKATRKTCKEVKEYYQEIILISPYLQAQNFLHHTI